MAEFIPPYDISFNGLKGLTTGEAHRRISETMVALVAWVEQCVEDATQTQEDEESA